MALYQICIDDKKCISVNDFGKKDGKVIVVNHGLIASIKDEALFKTLVDKEFRIISIARPGYGETSVFNMSSINEWGLIGKEVLHRIGISKYSVLGLSSGAPYSYAMAYNDNQVKNVYILSGTPALYLNEVKEIWPHPIQKEATLQEYREIAKRIFFKTNFDPSSSNNEQKDSYRNDCFGIALDLYLRVKDWKFIIDEIKQPVFLQHMKFDNSVPIRCAEITVNRFINGILIIKENSEHFSADILNEFIEDVILCEERK